MMGAFKTFIRVILTKLFGKPFSSPALTKILTGSAMISFDVFDTDMYLDSSTIEEILQNCGYDLTDVPIYVSSEYGKTKRSGNLFRTVLEHEEVEAGKVLHIGDNLISDYLMPKKCGMKSFLYRRV